MPTIQQVTSHNQVVDSIAEELKAYNDAILQLEIKNREYRPIIYTSPRLTNHRS